MKTTTLLGVLGVVLILPFAEPAQQPDVDREMEEAKALYQGASFTEAIVKLERAVQDLKVLQDREIRKLQLADAYLHLALSHFALEDQASAKAAFKAMARLDPVRRLDPQVYGPPVIELFEEARAEVPTEHLATPPVRSATSPPPVKKGGARTGLIVGGVAVAAGGAVAATASGGSTGASAPTPPATATPAPAAAPVVDTFSGTTTGTVRQFRCFMMGQTGLVSATLTRVSPNLPLTVIDCPATTTCDLGGNCYAAFPDVLLGQAVSVQVPAGQNLVGVQCGLSGSGFCGDETIQVDWTIAVTHPAPY